jgi:pimeloyl-ACP methyl ester carboxylesterase
MLTADLMIPAALRVHGAEVRTYDSQDDRGREDVLVLVHGTAGSTQSHFGFLFPILAAKQRVVSIDWAPPAHQGPLELDALAAQVAGAIEQLLPGRSVVLLGYSLGAVVAASLAAARPELVERLILVSGWMRTDLQQLLRNDVWWELREAAQRTGDDQALRSYSTFCAFGGPFLAAQTREAMAPGMAAMRFDAFGDAQMELNRRIDIVEQAHVITAPTLVVGCTHDQMVPIRHQKALFGAIEDARFAEIASGHAVVFERPSELSFHIQRFMDAPGEHPAGSFIPVPRP